MSKYGKQVDRDGVSSLSLGSPEPSTYSPADTSKKLDDDFVAAVWSVFDSSGNVLISKHKDYGPTNISRSPGGSLNGLRVRMHDKTARINHLIDSGATPENESLRDSFLDLMNYAAIALLVLDGNWPDE